MSDNIDLPNINQFKEIQFDDEFIPYETSMYSNDIMEEDPFVGDENTLCKVELITDEGKTLKINEPLNTGNPYFLFKNNAFKSTEIPLTETGEKPLIVQYKNLYGKNCSLQAVQINDEGNLESYGIWNNRSSNDLKSKFLVFLRF